MKKKILTELKQFQKLGRMCDFAVANRSSFAEGTAAAEALPEVISSVTDLTLRTAEQASQENGLREFARVTAEARVRLREEVEFLYHTARSIAAVQPGFDDRFQMRLVGDTRLLNAARSALHDAAPLAEAFVKHALRPDFLERLKSGVDGLVRAIEAETNAETLHRLARKALKDSYRAAQAAGRRFDGIMRNTFRDDRIALEAWKAVCRIPRARKESARAGKETPQSGRNSKAPAEPQVEPQPTAEPEAQAAAQPA